MYILFIYLQDVYAAFLPYLFIFNLQILRRTKRRWWKWQPGRNGGAGREKYHLGDRGSKGRGQEGKAEVACNYKIVILYLLKGKSN